MSVAKNNAAKPKVTPKENKNEVSYENDIKLHESLKSGSYDSSLKRIRKQLPTKLDRALSYLMHAKGMDSFSDALSRTIGRRRGIIAGSIFALVGVLIGTYLSIYYGYSYNYLLLLLFYVVGYVLECLIELLIKLIIRS